MLDLRMVLWFIFGFFFIEWALIFVLGISRLWKQFLIYSGIWICILLVQVFTNDITLPSWVLLPQRTNLPTRMNDLYNWIPSLIITIIPLGIYVIFQTRQLNENNSHGEEEK